MYSSRNTCPQCQCSSVHRSRRRFYDWPMFLLGFKAARCTSCGHRFYRSTTQTVHSSHAA